MKAVFNWDEVNALIHLLHSQGVCYLIGNSISLNEDDRTINPVSLIERLAACGYPLVDKAE